MTRDMEVFICQNSIPTNINEHTSNKTLDEFQFHFQFNLFKAYILAVNLMTCISC